MKAEKEDELIIRIQNKTYRIRPAQSRSGAVPVVQVIKEGGQTYYLSQYACTCPGFIFTLLQYGKGRCKHFRTLRKSGLKQA